MARRAQGIRAAMFLVAIPVLTSGISNAEADSPVPVPAQSLVPAPSQPPSDAPLSAPQAPPALPVPAPRAHRARAMQYGAFVGGTASEYDLCASRRLLPKKPAAMSGPAERIARKLIGRLKLPNGGADFSPYAFEGWDQAKRIITQHAAEYTPEKCAMVAAAWAALLASAPSP